MARQYAETLQPVADFDLMLFEFGEDGHTASLFADHEWGNLRVTGYARRVRCTRIVAGTRLHERGALESYATSVILR